MNISNLLMSSLSTSAFKAITSSVAAKLDVSITVVISLILLWLYF